MNKYHFSYANRRFHWSSHRIPKLVIFKVEGLSRPCSFKISGEYELM